MPVNCRYVLLKGSISTKDAVIPGTRPEDIELEKVVSWICDQPLTPAQIQKAILTYCEYNKIPTTEAPFKVNQF